jgi:hypothetical protein
MHAIPSWLVDQYNRAKKNGWLEYFRDAASKYGFTTEDLLGLGSRESNLENIVGDHGHGFSIMQLDIGSYGPWIRSGAWKDPEKAILKGAECLAAKRDQIVKASKQKVAFIKFRSGKTARFTPKPFNDEQLRQMTLAAYNSGMAAYYHFSIGNHIDAGTTGKDYSADVLKRSKDFNDLMARDHFGAAANDRQIEQPTGATPTPPESEAQPEPQVPFATIEEKYNAHADLLASDTTKAVGAKAGGGLLSGLTAIWSSTAGKVAVTLSIILIVGTTSYFGYRKRLWIKAFFSQGWTYFKGKF